MAGLPGTWLHSFIFLLQVYFHRQLVLDKKIQDRTRGGEEASRWLASSMAFLSSTPQRQLYFLPLFFSSPNLKRGFCMNPGNRLVNRVRRDGHHPSVDGPEPGWTRTSALKAMGLVLVSVSPHRMAFGCKRITNDSLVAQNLGTEEL